MATLVQVRLRLVNLVTQRLKKDLAYLRLDPKGAALGVPLG